MSDFVAGRELNAAFYREVVGPLVEGWPHAAGRLGTGSDVLGYDDARSTDHGWGPQLLLLVAERDVEAVRHAVDTGLPDRFAGWPVHFGWDDVPETHHVIVTTHEAWFVSHLGVDPTGGLSNIDWLLIPQRLWFLLHHTYWPYSKWFGTAFGRLPGSAPLARKLEELPLVGSVDQVTDSTDVLAYPAHARRLEALYRRE